MKYLRQFCIILLFSFLGEGLHIVLPLPVPASVYGLVLMLAALQTGILKTHQVKESAGFLIEIMPVMFSTCGGGTAELMGCAEASLHPGCGYNCSHYSLCHGSDRACDSGNYTEGEKE